MFFQFAARKAEAHHGGQCVERDRGARRVGMKAQNCVARPRRLEAARDDGADDEKGLAGTRAARQAGVALRPFEQAPRALLRRAERHHAKSFAANAAKTCGQNKRSPMRRPYEEAMKRAQNPRCRCARYASQTVAESIGRRCAVLRIRTSPSPASGRRGTRKRGYHTKGISIFVRVIYSRYRSANWLPMIFSSVFALQTK